MKLILSVAFIFFPLLNVEAESLFKEPVVHSAPANELGLPMSWVKSRQGRKELDDDYVVFIGSKGINKFWNTNFDGYITNVRISGEDAAYFNVDSTTCNPGVDYCESYVSFTPQQERYYHASILQDWYPCNLGDECEPYLLKLDFSGLGILEVEPGECDDESPGSIIKNDDRAVIEQIPIIGTDFQLSHSSRTTTQFKSGIFPALGRVSSFNPEGWSLSVHHLFKPSSNVLFMGDGNRMRRTPFATTSEFIRVVNGSEVFVFDLTGKHLETRSSLTGYVKYAFFYNDQDKLIKIKDAYGKETIFSRDLEGRLESITSPYGKTTTIALSSESGLISSVTNSNAESFSILYYPGTELIDR
ncbi:MAG: RHS repeat domain-containing protein [Bacteriovoracia bacterium]